MSKDFEVWFVSVGLNIGFEADGKGSNYWRPAVVLKKFNLETFWGVFLTSKAKTGKYYFSFSHGQGRISIANLSQIRLIDSKRMRSLLGSMSERSFLEMRKRIIELLR